MLPEQEGLQCQGSFVVPCGDRCLLAIEKRARRWAVEVMGELYLPGTRSSSAQFGLS